MGANSKNSVPKILSDLFPLVLSSLFYCHSSDQRKFISLDAYLRRVLPPFPFFLTFKEIMNGLNICEHVGYIFSMYKNLVW